MGTKTKSGATLPREAESPVPAQRITQADGENALSGVVDAALEIARKRGETLARLRKALEQGNGTDALQLARELCGLNNEKEGNRAHSNVN
jgi:hypothetical protein